MAFGYMLAQMKASKPAKTGATHKRNAVQPTLVALSIAWLSLAALQVPQYLHNFNYKPELALNYQDRFEKMITERSEAASALLESLTKGSVDATKAEKLEPILDLFEDVGFYCKNGQISADVAHHHFYHWVRIFCQDSQEYIHKRQQAEPATWEHLDFLLQKLTAIEAKKKHCSPAECRWSREKEVQYLQQEIEIASPKSA